MRIDVFTQKGVQILRLPGPVPAVMFSASVPVVLVDPRLEIDNKLFIVLYDHQNVKKANKSS